MKEISPKAVKITDGFWLNRLEVNARKAIFHQWKMLEESGCIDNFRIAAGIKEGLREGWFFADSDAYKWLDAAARIERNQHNEELCNLIDSFIELLENAQCEDGYLFTYNQIHFNGQRWINLQIEHELYCHGHLIEAGISHYEATGQTRLLDMARKAANLLVDEFLHAGPKFTPGHEEIEIALIKLWQVTGENSYLELAQHFLEMRGRQRFFGVSLVGQFASNGKREKLIAKRRAYYFQRKGQKEIVRVPAMNQAFRPPFSQVRFFVNALSGKYFQQHLPLRKQSVPVGHAVRMGYLNTAAAMLLQERPESDLLNTLQKSWEHMVSRRMDISGGLGALPDSEAFGNDFELNPEYAYNETCAAIASLLWNWQMLSLTDKVCFSDLFEWQLYNAVSVGMGWEGDSYFYNNPTLSRGGIRRQPWYSIPCCPSNISRTYADLGKYIVSGDSDEVWLHQYLSSEIVLGQASGLKLSIHSEFPWQGKTKICISLTKSKSIIFHLRIPSWAGKTELFINGESQEMPLYRKVRVDPTSSGFDPRMAFDLILERIWHDGDEIELKIEMPVCIYHPHKKVKALKGKIAIARGPILYCLEDIDQPEIDIFSEEIDVSSLHEVQSDFLIDQCQLLGAKTRSGKDLTFIPYSMWGNRGESKMTVWVKEP